MNQNELSYRARKALTVHIGEEAGAEISDLICRLCAEIEQLKRSKVDVTNLVPTESPQPDLFNESATF